MKKLMLSLAIFGLVALVAAPVQSFADNTVKTEKSGDKEKKKKKKEKKAEASTSTESTAKPSCCSKAGANKSCAKPAPVKAEDKTL